MLIEKCQKSSFTVIGKEGSTVDGQGFVQKLWEQANQQCGEISHLAKRDEKGQFLGVWGVMSDFSRTFRPWQDNFSEGLYLAGLECRDNAEAPAGWVKWVVPAYEYIYVKNDTNPIFRLVLKYLNESKMMLAGAVHDFFCPETGQAYLFFPVREL